MTDKPDKPDRTYHRPISMVVENVRPMPEERELPHQTQLTFNLKGNRVSGLLIIKEITLQILKSDFFAVEITGSS